uniref:MatE protein n=1 Tax=Candidatus Kentrum eta TaxID=2126337 RepID=A0A450U9A5_9GAMM|nr:MAG: hypothetical protein BECKH772A_GA0070896_1001021 [Candidatus Kentron sp. H]VFJ90741.1 MAG: hypothetical protein BECKH772B_GA0070898_1001121 [Candidatus Kentron sp. H]VFJ96880.1 MAG: hypothetical protein BECKH772C_GA0070978_1000921 [Candidatus Kentron sp. H]
MDFHLWTLFPAWSTFLFSLAFAAMGRAGTAALIVWLEVALNAVLDYGLIFGKLGLPAMGMEGAGLAGVIAYGAGHMAFFLDLAFHRFFRSAKKYRHAWRTRWHILRRFFHIGVPKGLELLSRTGLYSVFSLFSGWMGVQALAIHTMVVETVVVANQLGSAAGNAAAARVGMAYTGKNYVAIRHAFYGTSRRDIGGSRNH